jgi:primosomal protein N' (replication factor Y)
MIETGNLVAVTVRGQLEKGLIINIYEKRPEISRLLPLKDTLSAGPLITAVGLEIARWMSEYYLCSLNKTVHLFLPPPIRQKERKYLVEGYNDTSQHLLLGNLERLIYDEVVKKSQNGLSVAQLIKRFGAEAKEVIVFLLKQGLLIIKTEYVPHTNEKKNVHLELSTNAPDWQNIVKKAPRQAEIIKSLQEGPKTVEELRKTCVLSNLSVKTMQEKGWISIFESNQRRNPVTGKMKTSRPTRVNSDQDYAVNKICESIRGKERKNWLLFGVTGSGKTEVYLKAIEETLLLGRQILYLVPEISLTPQITSILIENFGSGVALLHSAMSAGERYDEWQRIKKGEASIVLGPRSAVFAPFIDLGLIIIDEEHENTFKQNEPDPRYDTRRVAEKAAEIYKSVIVRGSATPSLQVCYEAQQGEYELLRLPLRVASRPLPEIKIVDMKKESAEGKKGVFSQYLQESLERVFQANEQAILFINRRGFHTFLLCRECGLTINCPRCSITMTYHQSQNKLICHYCNYQQKAVQKCPSCGSHFLHYLGTGTQRVAAEFEKLFPEVRYTRIDADTTRRKGSHFQLLQEFEQGKSQVIIGTQMIAKGLNFPEVTLVGIINADIMINMPDYQSGERSYQLITQVAGRAGRGDKAGEVVVQTFNPDHYVYKTVVEQDFETYITQEMEIRMTLQYPPFHYLVRVLISGSKEKIVLDKTDVLKKIFKLEIERSNYDAEIYGPSPAPIFFLKGRFRYHILLKGSNLAHLQALAAFARDKVGHSNLEPRVIVDVEPLNLM